MYLIFPIHWFRYATYRLLKWFWILTRYPENLYLKLNFVHSNNKSFVLIWRFKSLRNATLQAPLKKLVSVQSLLLCAKKFRNDMRNTLMFFLLLSIAAVLIIFFSLLHPSFFPLILIYFFFFSIPLSFSFSLLPKKVYSPRLTRICRVKIE